MPFIDDFNYNEQFVGSFAEFAGGKIGDVTIGSVNTKSIDDSQVQALENQAAQLGALQKQREAEDAARRAAAAAAAAAAAKAAEEKKRQDAKNAILGDINAELGALASLVTRLNAIINIATPYKGSQFSDVATSATTIVTQATALKTTISNLVTQLQTAKATASNAPVTVSA
jgi:predicted component of type VI protein secretion system